MRIGTKISNPGLLLYDVIVVVQAIHVSEYPTFDIINSLYGSGASYVGVTSTTMNPAYTPKEIARQLKMSGAKWAVVNHNLVPVIKASIDILEREGIFKRGQWTNRIFVTGGKLSFK